MSRIAKLDVTDWDPELREIFGADMATPLEQGAMRMFARRPAIAKGVVALGAGIKADRTLPERLVELGVWVAFCVGFGRLAASWHMVEELPDAFRAAGAGPIAPWSGAPGVVR
jgi:hypothetical protein